MLYVWVVDIEGLVKLVCYVILYYIGFVVDLWYLWKFFLDRIDGKKILVVIV